MIHVFILAFFFISGLTGLIYEVLWTRLIVHIIGSAPFAVSIVLSVFMGGLGLGSYWAGRSIDRLTRPFTLIRTYGLLELIVGIYAVLLPALIAVFRPLHALVYNHLFAYPIIYNLITFAGCMLLLIVPVTCMGATLPILSRFTVTRLSHAGSHLGRLYGINTVGGAAGAFVCGFLIIDRWGIQGSIFFAAALNVVIGISSVAASLFMPEETVNTEPSSLPPSSPETNESSSNGLFVSGALVIFTVSGFCAMTYEVVWTRLLGLIVGPTTYSFSIVLITFITGLALGSMVFGKLGDLTGKPYPLLLYSQIAAGITALWISHIMGNSQIFFAKLIYTFSADFTKLEGLKSLVLFCFMFPTTFFLGATFPLTGKIVTNNLSRIGKSIGNAYALNTAGAVLGSFCGGFVLIPLFGKELSLRLVIVLQIAVAAFFTALYYRSAQKQIREWIPVTLIVLYGLAMTIPYPHWNRMLLSIGKYHRYDEPELLNMGWPVALFFGTEIFEDYHAGELVYYGDGIGGFTTVKKDTDSIGTVGYSLFNTGKSDASTDSGDMVTQTLLAHFPLLFHDNPRRVMVLGLASGITAGEVLNYPVEHLDVIEINNQVVEASSFFTPWNNAVLDNPRTELIIQDGRAHIELTDRMYDVIISEPSNPWMEGLASLFTREFFTAVRDRLDENGIFTQWVHAYQMDWNTFSLVGRTFIDVFPRSLLVVDDPTGLGYDYLLVGFKGNKTLDLETAARNLAFARKSHNITLLNPGIFFNLVVAENLDTVFGPGPLNTDNRPHLEYMAPKLMHISDPSITDNIVAKSLLSITTNKVRRDILTDVDGQLDYVTYCLSFDRHLNKIIYFEHATPAQWKRFENLMVTYCSDRLVDDFSFIPQDDIRRKCIAAQMGFVRSRLSETPHKAPLYFHLGNLALRNGMTGEAVSLFQTALTHDPEYDEAHYNLARIYNQQGETDSAIVHYSEAIRINPYNVRAYNNLGNIMLHQGKADEAIRLYRAALDIQPDFASAHRNLGSALISTGNTPEGEKHLQEALHLEQKSVNLQDEE